MSVRRMLKTRWWLFIVLGMFFNAGATSQAIEITPESDPWSLVAALTTGAPGLVVTGVTLSGHSTDSETSTGTFTNLSGVYGIGPGVILSTGNVRTELSSGFVPYEDGPNTESFLTTADYGVAATPAQEDLMNPITGADSHFDVTQLDIHFDLLVGFDKIFFDLVFGSEEFPEFPEITDGLGVYLNGVNIALLEDLPISAAHPRMDDMDELTTELDGVLDPRDGQAVHRFFGRVGNGRTGNTLSFILGDAFDGTGDTVAYLSHLEAVVVNPEPASLLLLGSGLAGLWGMRRRAARAQRETR